MYLRPDDGLLLLSKRACREIAKMQIALEGIVVSAGSGVIADIARAGLVLPPGNREWQQILDHLKHLNRHLNRIADMDDSGDMIARHCIDVARRERFSEGELAA